VTFKQTPCEDVIRYAQGARLQGIEWHGLNHVPHGDLDAARRIGRDTRAAELAVAAYGSYYVLGQSEDEGLSFDTVVQTAAALGAPMVRVWAGNLDPDQASPRFRTSIVDQARRSADRAAQKEIKLVFEFHKGTLTRTGESCAALLEALNHPNAATYWQPAPELDVEQNLTQLRCVLPWLVGLHVFHWGPTDRDRHPLSRGEGDWAQYLALAGQCPGRLTALLEFVRGGAVEQFKEDAATLHRLVEKGALHDSL
jgi:3-dehydroshikimate dehydratase